MAVDFPQLETLDLAGCGLGQLSEKFIAAWLLVG
jgi:hypothetical protein